MTYYVTEVNTKKDGMPRQPNSLETKLKCLFSIFSQNGINYSLKKDFNYPGGFGNRLQEYWSKVQKTDVTFGARPTKKALPDNYGFLVRKAVEEGCMDASGGDPFELLVLFAFVLGTMFAFRGVKEYHELRFENLQLGQWSHDTTGVGGREYLEVLGNLETKKKKLSLNTPTFYSDSESRRVIDNPNDILSPCSLFKKIRKLAHPNQEYVFCHTMTKSVKKKLELIDIAWRTVEYDSSRRMGATTIGKFCKIINERCKIKDSGMYSNHDWRTYCITRLNNDPGVSMAEQISFSGHASVTSSKPYLRKGENSNAAFQKAIHSVPLPSREKWRKMKKASKKVPQRAKKVPSKVTTRSASTRRASARIAARTKIET